MRATVRFPQMVSLQTKPFFKGFVLHSVNRFGLFVRLCYRSSILRA